MRRWAGLSFCVLVAGCDVKQDDEPPPQIGSANVSFLEGTGGAPTGALVGEKLFAKYVRRCEDSGLIGKDDCFSEHIVNVSAGGRSIVYRRRLGAVPSDGLTPVSTGESGFAGDANEVTLSVDSNVANWSTGPAGAGNGSIKIDVAPDGKITYRFERVKLSNLEKTSTVILEGELVLDCRPDGERALCPDFSGTARP